MGRAEFRYSPYLFIAPFFLLFAVFGLYPLGRTLWVSLHDWSLLGTHSWVGLDNYAQLMVDTRFWNAVRNTLGIFLLATIPQIMLALLLAQALNRRLRARTTLRMGVLIPNVTSVAAVGIIFTLIFARDFGLANWLLGLVGIDPINWQNGRLSSWAAISVMVDWRWTGYNALILLAAMQAIPKDLYEAAEIDGAGHVAAVLLAHDPAAPADPDVRRHRVHDRRRSSCSPSRCCSTPAPARWPEAPSGSSRRWRCTSSRRRSPGRTSATRRRSPGCSCC